MPIFGLNIPQNVAGINPSILNPQNNWLNKDEYNSYLQKVANLFIKNFKRF